jgi:hypothetical protein
LCYLILSFVIVCKEFWWPIPHSSLLESSPRILSWADFSSCCRAVTVTARYYSNCCVLLTNSAQMQLYCSEWLAAAGLSGLTFYWTVLGIGGNCAETCVCILISFRLWAWSSCTPCSPSRTCPPWSTSPILSPWSPSPSSKLLVLYAKQVQPL